MKIKARDLNLTLVTFWILLAVKCPLENYSNPYGYATATPPAWGLSEWSLGVQLFWGDIFTHSEGRLSDIFELDPFEWFSNLGPNFDQRPITFGFSVLHRVKVEWTFASYYEICMFIMRHIDVQRGKIIRLYKVLTQNF